MKYITILFASLALLPVAGQCQTVIQAQSAITIAKPVAADQAAAVNLDDDTEEIIPAEVSGDRSRIIADGAVPTPPTPKWSQVEQAFDSVAVGQLLTATFEVKNLGATPLLLKEVKTRGTALGIAMPKEAIATGATAKVVVTFTPAVKGKIAEYLTIFTNAEDPTVQLSILGLAIQP